MNRHDQLNTPRMKALCAFRPKISMASDKEVFIISEKDRQQAERREKRVTEHKGSKIDE